MIERELTERVSLTLPNDRLNRDAVGWARQPIVDTSAIGRGWGRNKRWEYWSITTPTHLIALTVSSIDYAAVHEVWIFHRATRAEVRRAETILPARGVSLPASLEDPTRAETILPARGVSLPASLEGGPTRARTHRLSIEIDELSGSTRLRAVVPRASLEIFAARPERHERLAVVVPWSDRRFQYTVKDVARPASGRLVVEGREYDIPPGESWAVLDHGRGRWPYDVRWNWGAGSGVSSGRTIGLQVGGKWTDGTGSTENSILIDGRLHKISAELRWEYDLTNWAAPWRVTGGGLDAVLEPFHNKKSRTRLGVISSRTDQCFGVWSGRYTDDGGSVTEFDGLVGFAEDVHNRW